MRECQKEVEETAQALNRHIRDAQSLRIAMQKADEVVEKLQDALEEDAIEEGRLDALKESLREAEEDKATQEGSYGESVITADKFRDAMRDKREEMRAIDVRIEEATMKLGKAKAKAEKFCNQRTKDLQQKNSVFKAVQDAKDRLAGLEKELEEAAHTVAEYTAQAQQISVRVPVPHGETVQSLDNKLTKLDEDLKRGTARSVHC